MWIAITLISNLIIVLVMGMMNAASKTDLYREIDCLRAESNEWEKKYYDLMKIRSWSEGMYKLRK